MRPARPETMLASEWHRLGQENSRAMLRIQSGILQHLRDILRDDGFIESLAPVMGPVTDPGTRGAKQGTVDYYGHRYKLMSSAILYKQLMLHGADRIFMLAPCIRMEPAGTKDTGRHLTEFYQLDLEIRGGDLAKATAVAERLVRQVVQRIWQTHADDLTLIHAPQWDLAAPFKRLTHSEAVQELACLGHDVSPDAEIPWDAERALSEHAGGPVFITHYPRGARGFYDREDPEAPGTLLDFDLLYPGGYGEAISGAEREHTLERVVGRIREAGEDLRKYGWYVDMLRDGCPPSAGFGIGVERLTRFICGLDSVADARPFPKTPGSLGP